jgi:ABC-type uncharacterized transport system substrate-binding protein
MRRRDALTLLGGAAFMPFAARAEQLIHRIGTLTNGTETDQRQHLYNAAFDQVLRSRGWRIGQNLHVERRWSRGDAERSLAQATELVSLTPDVIIAHTTVSLTAALQATRTIPIVFNSVSDPVAQGLVSSLTRPGGNATGFGAYEFSIGGKWLDVLKQVAPSLSHVGLMFNPTNSPQSKFFLNSVEAVAPTLGIDVTPLPVQQLADIEPALATLARRPNGGLIIGTDNFLVVNRAEVVEQAARHRLPGVYGLRDFVQAGGLISYSFDTVEGYRGAALYVDRILKGAKPGDLPVQMASKFTLAINLTAAQKLGVEMPMGLMLRADEVVE